MHYTTLQLPTSAASGVWRGLLEIVTALHYNILHCTIPLLLHRVDVQVVRIYYTHSICAPRQRVARGGARGEGGAVVAQQQQQGLLWGWGCEWGCGPGRVTQQEQQGLLRGVNGCVNTIIRLYCCYILISYYCNYCSRIPLRRVPIARRGRRAPRLTGRPGCEYYYITVLLPYTDVLLL